MPRSSSLKVVLFPAPISSPKFSNISSLPSGGQQKLHELVARFDRVMKHHPNVAVRILFLAEKLLQAFGA